MKPVIKAKKWWWPPDRRKARLANEIQQFVMNKERQDYIDEVQRSFRSQTVNIKLNKDGSFSPKDPRKPSWFVTGDKTIPVDNKPSKIKIHKIK